MVQHRTKNSDQPDDHWKLTKYLHSTVKRLCPGAAERAQELFSRNLRGLLDYGLCTVKELRRFSLHRKLLKAGEGSLESDRPGDGASNHLQFQTMEQEKASLVALLEKADDDQGFDRFLDLPPELRACTYDSYFRWLLEMNDESLTSPIPPPITEGCSILCKETLKPFYQTCFLDLRFEESGGRYRTAEKESNFFLNAPPSYVAMVRQIKLRCESELEDAGFRSLSRSMLGLVLFPTRERFSTLASLTRLKPGQSVSSENSSTSGFARFEGVQKSSTGRPPMFVTSLRGPKLRTSGQLADSVIEMETELQG